MFSQAKTSLNKVILKLRPVHTALDVSSTGWKILPPALGSVGTVPPIK